MKEMKRVIISCVLSLFLVMAASAERLVILHTNDTHSQIEPTDKDKGGVLRRKALIDSIEAVNDHVLLVDAGDAVQGTVYFNLYKGAAEQQLMNEMGYDLRTIGNHEFDNGVESLVSMIEMSNARFLSSNYEFDDARLDSMVSTYYIHEVEGRHIAFIALNIDPEGLVSPENYKGVKYLEVIETANTLAKRLKEEQKVDAIVALTHIGYVQDVLLAENSRYIDVIIGGHSHDLIDPNAHPDMGMSRTRNLDRNIVLVAQADKSGRYLGEVTIDLEDMSVSSKVIAVDGRLDSIPQDANMAEIINGYRNGVEELMHAPVATTKHLLERDSERLRNLVTDMVYFQARKIYDRHIDLAIMNSGGIRNNLPKGEVSVGEVMSVLPFNNHIVVLEIKGEDLLEAFDVMASRGGDCVSYNVSAEFDATTGKCTKVRVGGRKIEPHKTYRLATIDYLANGGDYMTPLTRGKIVAEGEMVLYDEMIAFMTNGVAKSEIFGEPIITGSANNGKVLGAYSPMPYMKDKTPKYIKKITEKGGEIDPPSDVRMKERKR